MSSRAPARPRIAKAIASRLRGQVVGFLALFLVLASGGAYAAQGAQRPQGDRAPSEAFEREVFVFHELGIDGVNDGEVLAELPLEPGAYVLTATADLSYRGPENPGATSCWLFASYESDDAQTSLGALAGQVSSATLSMTLVDTFEAPVTAKLSCVENLRPGVVAGNVKLIATRVATAHEG